MQSNGIGIKDKESPIANPTSEPTIVLIIFLGEIRRIPRTLPVQAINRPEIYHNKYPWYSVLGTKSLETL